MLIRAGYNLIFAAYAPHAHDFNGERSSGPMERFASTLQYP
jgi:hypothetical protein